MEERLVNNPENFSEFSEKAIRLGATFLGLLLKNGFIRKVYGILTCQLAVTIAVMSIFLFVEPVKLYCQRNIWLWIVMFIATFVCIIVLSCCPDVRRSYPANMIFLALFTVCEAVLLGSVSCFYNVNAVLIAVGVTCLVVFGLTLFAFQTKFDFTVCNGALFIITLILIIFGILCAFIQSHILNLVYASLGALIFSLYILVDTQMIVGGKHKYAISPEEYIFGALNLYLDIINLFLFVLQIISEATE